MNIHKFVIDRNQAEIFEKNSDTISKFKLSSFQ